jgi:hypothetical protein
LNGFYPLPLSIPTIFPYASPRRFSGKIGSQKLPGFIELDEAQPHEQHRVGHITR